MTVVELTHRDGSVFYLNPHVVVTVEATPDTVITLTTGIKLLVRENVEEVVEKMVNYRKQLNRGAYWGSDE